LQAPAAALTANTAGNSLETRICITVTLVTFIALVLLMWLPYTMHSGFNGETMFVYTSETSSFWRGFLYQWDPLRPYTSLFYHLGYVLGEALQVRGSFVPYQAVHAALWLARGVLTFLILRKFLPDHTPFCFLAGVIVLVHSSDGAIQWVGQMNQFGFIFWMLLAFYLLNLAVESRQPYGFVLLTLAACLCAYMSLWSYEAQLFLILLMPLTMWLFRRACLKRALAASVLWYAVPIRYIFDTIARYRQTGGASYQESVMRKSWKAADVAGDWWFNVRSSLEFWNWTRNTRVELPPALAKQIAVAGALIFLIGAVALLWTLRRGGTDVLRERSKPLWWALGTGVVATVLSFPVYLLLEWQRGLWRTQFLSGIGAGITLSALACLVSRQIPARALRAAVFLAFGAAVAYSGVHAAIVRGAFHRHLWEIHRSAVAQILSVLPSVRPETVFIYTGVPKIDDPFTDNMWFDMALRLAYPNTPVAGEYFYADGAAAPGNCFTFVGERCRWTRTGIESLVPETSTKRVVVLEYQKQGPAKILPRMPLFLHVSEAGMSLYSPDVVLNDAPISPLAFRRYGPIPTLPHARASVSPAYR
jgi:hypothetical protein